MTVLSFRFHSASGIDTRAVDIERLIIAGWTGRDPAAVEKHIRELEELGVRRPTSVPVFYRASAARLTTGWLLKGARSAPRRHNRREPAPIRPETAPDAPITGSAEPGLRAA